MAAKAIEVDENGAYTFMFINENPTAIAAAARSLDDIKPDKTLAVHSTLLGHVPPGESGHFHIAAGIDFIYWVG